MSDDATASDATAVLVGYLDGHDAPCPSCRYNLRGLTGNRCPECNEALELRVGLAEPKMAWFVAGLVGLSLGAGFSGLLFLYFMYITYVLNEHHADPLGAITGIGVMVEGALLAWLILGRRRFGRMGIGARWSMAIGAWVLTVVNFVVFTLSVK